MLTCNSFLSVLFLFCMSLSYSRLETVLRNGLFKGAKQAVS